MRLRLGVPFKANGCDNPSRFYSIGNSHLSLKSCTNPGSSRRALHSRPFKFHVGASFMGKPPWPGEEKPPYRPFPSDHPVIPFRDKMLAWPTEVQKGKAKELGAGEDFFYVQEMRHKSGLSIGIADGVGGWSDVLDPGLFSQALMYYSAGHARHNWPNEPEIDPTRSDPRQPEGGHELTPQQCLDMAFNSALKDDAVVGGSSTACIVQLNATSGMLKSANLGDSGFYIIRSNSIIHGEPPQTHMFNAPLQLCKFPHSLENEPYAQDKLKGMAAGHFTDYPSNASTLSTSVRHGDIIILYTDGLYDNVFHDEVLGYTNAIMRRSDSTSEPELAQKIADTLVLVARRNMFNDRVTPFEVESRHAGWRNPHFGGKIDDVTVLTVIVQEDTSDTPPPGV